MKGRNLNWFDNTKGAISGLCQYGNPLARGCSGNTNAPKWLRSVQVWDNLMQLSPLRSASGAHVFSQPRVLHFPGISVVYCVAWVYKILFISQVEKCSEERAPSTGVTGEWGGVMREGWRRESEREEKSWITETETEGGTMRERVWVFDPRMFSLYNWMWMCTSWTHTHTCTKTFVSWINKQPLQYCMYTPLQTMCVRTYWYVHLCTAEI